MGLTAAEGDSSGVQLAAVLSTNPQALIFCQRCYPLGAGLPGLALQSANVRL